ncbi:MAG: Mu-like prophage major head subunit gpT family protein, partial [Anaerotardibacter sp.]
MMMENLKFDIQMFATPVQPNITAGTGNAHGYTAAEVTSKANFGKLLEPGLRKIFFETYDELPEQFPKVYNVETSTKAREVDWGMGAFGDWTKRATQIDEVAYKQLKPGLERSYIHDAFTQGFMVTREMYDDDQYRQFEKFPKAMARSGRAKVEKDAASLFKNGFTVNGYDGKPLFAADHPMLNATGTVSNIVTGALSDATLKLAIKAMREMKDEAGNLIQLKATKLIVPPALEDTAVRLLGSSQVTGGSLNDTNKFLNG